ncbi:MAG: thioredoxin TrxC [Pirellulaceae bacterium]
MSCANCLAVNRVPQDRLADKPVCGRCKASLLPDHPVELNDQNFDKFLARSGLPVVVDFWAPWCGPCRMMAPEFAAASQQLSGNVLFAKLNTEDHGRLASRFGIQGIPCMILFDRGRETARQSGAMRSSQIVQWVTKSKSY